MYQAEEPNDQSGPGGKWVDRLSEQKVTGAHQQLSEEAEKGWSAWGVTSEAVSWTASSPQPYKAHRAQAALRRRLRENLYFHGLSQG